MAHPVTWFQISGKDGGRLQTFYKNVFSWRIKPSVDGMLGMVSPDKPGGIPGGVGVARQESERRRVRASRTSTSTCRRWKQQVDAEPWSRSRCPATWAPSPARIETGSASGSRPKKLEPPAPRARRGRQPSEAKSRQAALTALGRSSSGFFEGAKRRGVVGHGGSFAGQPRFAR